MKRTLALLIFSILAAGCATGPRPAIIPTPVEPNTQTLTYGEKYIASQSVNNLASAIQPTITKKTVAAEEVKAFRVDMLNNTTTKPKIKDSDINARLATVEKR